LIDSVDAINGFQGQLIINSRPNPLLNRRDTLRAINETIKMVGLRERITQLDFASVKVDPIIDPKTDERWRAA